MIIKVFKNYKMQNKTCKESDPLFQHKSVANCVDRWTGGSVDKW